MNENDQRRLSLELARALADCTKDGEDREGEPFEMSGDDAYETLHSFISWAREITGQQ